MIKHCKHCGEEFETNNPQKIYCNRPHYRPCPVCGVPVKMIDNDFSRQPKCCSSKCAHQLRKQKFKPKICIVCGKEFTPSTGAQVMCNDVHIVKCEICGKPFELTHENREDGVTTCSPECRKEKTRRFYNTKYGVDHPMKSTEVQKNFHKAMLDKYGVAHALQIPGKVKQQQDNVIVTNMERFGVPYACLSPNNVNSNHVTRISKLNMLFTERLKSYNIDIISMEKPVDTKMYDIELPNNILIEIDPTYTHSTVQNHYNQCVGKYYHRDKSDLAEKNGYRCIHVFDWDNWTNIIEMLLLNKSKIYARNCTIYKLNLDVTEKFLNTNHLKGSCRGQLLCLGLVCNGELVQVMTFGKPRYNHNYDVELLRLCTKSGHSVIGGASKLFKFATQDYGLNNIISYCDQSKFTGDVYTQIGMKFKYKTPPQEIWSKNAKKITANLLRARGYDQLFGTDYGKGTSNEELMLKNGWLPIYDCGQRVYTFEAD